VTISRDNFSRRYSVVAGTRREWSEAEKQAIVAEAARPGANISAVARRHGIRPNQLFRWRRLVREDQERKSKAVFVPVTVTPPPASPEATPPEAAPIISPDALSACPTDKTAQTDDRIEIELGNGRLVRVVAGIDASALKCVLDVVDGPAASANSAGRKSRS
jgi:transposase